MPAIIGKKLGMTQVFTEDGSSVPVTVIEAGPCKVTALRNAERDGYEAVQLAFGEVAERKLTKPELGHLAKAGAPPSRTLVEFRDETWPIRSTPSEPSADAPGREAEEASDNGEADSQELKVGDDVTVSLFAP